MELVIQTLTRKRAEIIGAIKKHEAQIAQAKHDLAHVNATLKILDGSNSGNRAYIVSQGFFAKGEIAAICQRHLADGPLNTRELAERVMGEKGLDISDTPLRNSVVYKVCRRSDTRLGAMPCGWLRSVAGCVFGKWLKIGTKRARC